MSRRGRLGPVFCDLMMLRSEGFVCRLVSLRLLRRRGMWWDNKLSSHTLQNTIYVTLNNNSQTSIWPVVTVLCLLRDLTDMYLEMISEQLPLYNLGGLSAAGSSAQLTLL